MYMIEGPAKRESAPSISGVDAFESLVKRGEWNSEIEAELDALLEKHEADLYMLYLNYKESGLVDSLDHHERKMYEWLAKQFEEKV